MPYVFTVCFCRTYQYHAVVNKLQLFRVKGGGGGPKYEEIPTPESGSQRDIQLQHNAAYVAVQSSH